MKLPGNIGYQFSISSPRLVDFRWHGLDLKMSTKSSNIEKVSSNQYLETTLPGLLTTLDNISRELNAIKLSQATNNQHLVGRLENLERNFGPSESNKSDIASRGQSPKRSPRGSAGVSQGAKPKSNQGRFKEPPSNIRHIRPLPEPTQVVADF